MKEHEIHDRLYEIKERLNLRPYSPILNSLFLTYNFMLKNYDVVETHAEALSMDSPTPCVLYDLFRGISYLIREKIFDANVAFKYVLTTDPENQYAYLFKGIVNLKEGKNAQEPFSKAIALAPKYEKDEIIRITNEKEDEKLKIILSEENISRKEFISILEELERTTKNDPILKVALAEAYTHSGEYEKVIPLLENVLVNYPNYPRANYIMARIIDEFLGNHEKANDYFKKVIEVNPLSRFRVTILEDERIFKIEDLNELISLYKNEKPLIRFFESVFNELKKEEKPEESTVQVPKVEESAKEEKATEKPHETPKIEEKFEEEKTKERIVEVPKVEEGVKEESAIAQGTQKSQDELSTGINLIKEKRYEEALKFFLNKLKESQNK